jgi:glycosyltransferase involved in cell wall biosynthesis
MNDRPLNIVHYIPSLRLFQGGVVRAILDNCSVLAARGHQMTAIVYQGEDLRPDWVLRPNPRAIVVPRPYLPGRPLSRTALKIADESMLNTDVLHLHAPWLDGNRQLAKIAKRRGIPYMVSTHGFLNDWAMQQRPLKKMLYMKLFGTRFMNNAAAIHCTAPAELAQAGKWFTNPRTIILPLLSDLTPFENLPGPESALALLPPEHRNQRKILMLSRLHEKKGVDILIRAAAQLRDEGQNFVLLLAGTGEAPYERLLKDLTAQLNLTNRVLFLGLITGTKKISLYQCADLFVLPTLQENFALVLTEALACGTPVITTRGTDIWPQIQQAGGFISEATPAAIADSIRARLSNPAELAEVGRKGRAWVFDNLAQGPLAARYETLYRDVAQQRPVVQSPP